jgi:L-alanine-DL-glutamate epimerase-like enolase superfamily enzyme
MVDWIFLMTIYIPYELSAFRVDIFALSMLAAVPNAFEFMEFDAINTKTPPSGSEFFTNHVFELYDGAMKLPSGTGWGVELKPGLLAKATNKTTTRAWG